MNKLIIKMLNVFLILFLSIISTGCWDYKEIEKRGYVLGIAIDNASPIPKGYEDTKSYKEEQKLEIMELQQGQSKYAYTLQIPIIPKAQVKPVGMSSAGGGEPRRSWDLTIIGNSFFEVNREFSTKLDYAPFYEHLQIIIISEKVAREGIFEPLDMILRDPEMRRRTQIFITPEKAHKVLDVMPRIDDYASFYLAQMRQNAVKTSRMAHLTDLGIVSESLHSRKDFALPKVISTEEEIKTAGVAVFKGDKIVGWLGEIHTLYLKWVRDLVLGGVLVIKAPNDYEGLITLQINKVKTKVRPVIEGNTLKMHIESKATMDLAEETKIHYHNALNQDFLVKVEHEAEKTVKGNMQNIIEYIQKELEADILNYSVILQQYEPSIWDSVKDNWNETFKNLETDIEIDVKLNRIGVIK